MIIGITGHARHGKDSTADFICKHFRYQKKALADRMKSVCALIFDWNEDHLYGDLKDKIDPRWGISPRHVLQSLGTEWGQHELSKHDSFKETTGRLLWTRSLLSQFPDDANIVISDVRFLHEADEVRRRGGKIVMVRRPGYPVDLSHESERSIEEIKPYYVLRNASGLKELEEDVMEMMKSPMFTT